MELEGRELAVVGAALIDTWLANLLAKRLAGPDEEIVTFLGANEDGRAPCGSFGARIQLGLLIGVISDQQARVFRAVKEIRNRMAHRVLVDFTDDKLVGQLNKLADELVEAQEPGSPALRAAKQIKALLGKPGENAANVVLWMTLAVHHDLLAESEKLVVRLEPVKPLSGGGGRARRDLAGLGSYRVPIRVLVRGARWCMLVGSTGSKAAAFLGKLA